jgi:hypothetical protein
VDVLILSIAGCPGAALLAGRLEAALDGIAGVNVTYRVITSEAEASAAGMRGSPTVLADGSDPFAGPGDTAGLACRLYPQDDGSLAGAPSVGELRRVLTGAGAASP